MSEEDVRMFMGPMRALVARAMESEPGRVSLEVGIHDDRVILLTEDDGAGMSPSQLDALFDATASAGTAWDEAPFGADAVHISTTRGDTTVKARSHEPPEYSTTEFEAADWEAGSRVEMHFDAPADVGTQLTADAIRGAVAHERFPCDVEVSLRVDDS